MKNYGDIKALALFRIDEEAGDEQIDAIIEEAINYSYMNDLAKLDQRFVRDTFVPEDGVILLPDDLDSIEKITPALTSSEYRKGNAVFVEGDSYSILYSTIPSALENDTDVPDVTQKLWHAMTTYACYEYFLFKKKPDVAASYKQQYQYEILEANDDNLAEGVLDYYTVGGDE